MKKFLILIFAAAVFLFGCVAAPEEPAMEDTMEDKMEDKMEDTMEMKPVMSTLTLNFTNLMDLPKGHYEGWAIFGSEKVSTGKFNPNDELTFTIKRNLSAADKIVITIEPEGDIDDIPAIPVLVGDLKDNKAFLNFPVNLNDISGNYILATPTDGSDSFETSGIWFLMLPGPTTGLVLPNLTNGWVYEGWVVNQGVPLTSGKFSSADDFDLFSDYSGSMEGPPFPGEDYLTNPPMNLVFPINLSDGKSKAVISIEPDINGIDPTGEGPFQIKPLIGDIPKDAKDHVNYQMDLNLGSLPTGAAIVGIADAMDAMEK
jgi:hypothetical protein